MTPGTRAIALVGTALLLGGAVVVRATTRDAVAAPAAAAVLATGTGTLLEFGSTRCAGCKAMHAELGLLRSECAKGPQITEVDVFTDEALPTRYGVTIIPTQVFLDASGAEFDRHEGFLPRADILQRFASKHLGCQP